MDPRTIVPIKKAPTLVEQVCQQLASMLRNGSVAASEGKLMAERGLAAQLGVSRNVLREATKRLELQGLVEIRQGHGTRVVNKLHKPLTAALNLLVPNELDRMQQLFEIRLILEPQSARLAALRSTPTQLLQIEAAQIALKSPETIEDAVEADMNFHRSIAEASGNQILLLVLESLAELRAESHSKGYRKNMNSRTWEMHQVVLAAIQKQNGDAAAAAMAAHILEAKAILAQQTTTQTTA